MFVAINLVFFTVIQELSVIQELCIFMHSTYLQVY